MDYRVITVCLAGFILLAVLVGPAAADPTITSVSPSEGYNNGTLTGVTITGTGFNLTSGLGSVVLRKSGESDIPAIIPSPGSSTTTLASCQFRLSGKTAGTWDVVITNQDGSTYTYPSGFIVRNSMTLSSISPSSAQTNNNSVAVTVSGTSLSYVSGLYLYNSSYTNKSATIGDVADTYAKGTFDLTNVKEAIYSVCVVDFAGTTKCGLSFEVKTDKAGEIDVSSDPTGAYIYLDSKYMGNTPDALTGITPGTHVIKVSKDGYSDWSEIVKVTNGGTTTIKAALSVAGTAVPTTVPTSTPTTVKTAIKVTTIKVPTSWAKTTTTKASPVEAGVILGAIGLGILVLHRRH